MKDGFYDKGKWVIQINKDMIIAGSIEEGMTYDFPRKYYEHLKEIIAILKDLDKGANEQR